MHAVLETPGGTGLYLSFNVFGWIIATLLISLGLWQITLNKKITYSRLHLYCFLGLLLLFIPMFYGSEFSDHAIPRLLALTGGLVFLFCLYQFPALEKNPQQLLWWVLIAVAIQAVFGLIQYFILVKGDWGGYTPGVSRPHGSFMQPNVMASFMAMGIALALYLSVTIKTYTPQKTANKLALWFCYFCLFCTVFLVTVLQSRTGHIAALLVIVFIAPYLYIKNKKQFTINMAWIIFSFIITLISFQYSDVTKRGEDSYQQTGTRPNIYLVTTEMIKEKPLQGVGYGNYERAFLDTYNRYVIDHPEIGDAIQRMAHPHNEVLFWVSEGGLIALLGLLFFIFAYTNSWLKITNKKQALAILALIMPLLLHSQLEFPFYSSISHWFVFLILIYFTDINSSSEKTRLTLNRTFLIRFFAIFSPLIFIPFLLTSLQTGMVLVEHEKSGYQHLEKLVDIVNPIAWQERLDATVYAHILITGLQEKDPKALAHYINWGLKRIRHKPRVNIYSNVLLCLQILNREDEYQTLLVDAKRTYPLVEKWGRNILETEID